MSSEPFGSPTKWLTANHTGQERRRRDEQGGGGASEGRRKKKKKEQKKEKNERKKERKKERKRRRLPECLKTQSGKNLAPNVSPYLTAGRGKMVGEGWEGLGWGGVCVWGGNKNTEVWLEMSEKAQRALAEGATWTHTAAPVQTHWSLRREQQSHRSPWTVHQVPRQESKWQLYSSQVIPLWTG